MRGQGHLSPRELEGWSLITLDPREDARLCVVSGVQTQHRIRGRPGADCTAGLL